MQKFNIGDKVKIIGNTYGGYWKPGYDQLLKIKDFFGEDIDVEGWLDTGRVAVQTYHPDDLELIEDEPYEVFPSEVEGFEIHRSLASNTLYSVFAVDFFGEILYPVCVDATWDWAVKTKEDQEKELQSA